MCQFYADHQQADPARTLAQHVSLALYLNAPPELTLKVKESDLPPDASYVSGFVPLLQKFYGDAGLHAIWTRHQTRLLSAYRALSRTAVEGAVRYRGLPEAAIGWDFWDAALRFISTQWEIPDKPTPAITDLTITWSFLPAPDPDSRWTRSGTPISITFWIRWR